jgi:pimeloyl-ACP methyl ester carboxylesterase
VSRFVPANGARFHVVEAGRGPIVILLHGFPQTWWSWRHQLAPLAEAGYRAIAMDLRGYGDSDKTPRGYDPMTLAADVAATVKSLGARDAVVVGQGWGGYVAWTVAARHPGVVRGLCPVSAPHPLEMLASTRAVLRRRPLIHLLSMQVPWLPERRIKRGSYLARHLQAWSSPANRYPSEQEVDYYRSALSKWPSPHCALEYHRWLFRSRLRADGRAYHRLMRTAVAADVLSISGADDAAVPGSVTARSSRHVTGRYAHAVIADAGHFVPEERPDATTAALLGWLRELDGLSSDPIKQVAVAPQARS